MAMYWALFLLALLPAALHSWWTRAVTDPGPSAVLPERHLAITQRVSFVSMLCVVAIVVGAGWLAVWPLLLQFIALTASTYRMRRAMFGETWPFPRYLSWRARFHAAMFGLWWVVAAAPLLIAQAPPPIRWWTTGLVLAIGLAWHHWNGRILLWLLRASPLARPDLDAHFQRVFAAARVPTPVIWRAGADGGRLANAFAMITLGQRGVLFLDGLLDQLTPDEITAILAHEVAHLEQFHPQRLRRMYAGTMLLIVLLTIGSAVAAAAVAEFASWCWIVSVGGVFAATLMRARRMQGHETDADRRALELCGDADALIRGLTRIYEINHIPRRWSAVNEQRSTHPSLARRLRAIQASAPGTAVVPEPIEALLAASPEPGRCAVIDRHRVAFAWIDGAAGDVATVLDRASRVEMVAFDQLGELRLSAARSGIELVAVDHHARRWSMPVHEDDAARIQAALDRVDHLIAALPPRRDFSIARRAAVLLAIIFGAPYNAIGAVLVPALLALRRPKRPLMMAMAAALAGTAVASVNDPNASVVRFVLLTLLTLIVLWSVRRHGQEEQPEAAHWEWIERGALLVPVLIGLIFAAANATDLFGLHSAVRDRAWFTAALAAMAVFYVAQTTRRASRRAGLGVAIAATAALVVGSPWFLLHAVADPLVADMPGFSERSAPATAVAKRSVEGQFTSLRLTPSGDHFLMFGPHDEAAVEAEEPTVVPPRQRFIAAGFDGWSREIDAFDVVVIDDRRLLVVDRDPGSSRLRAEDLRSGDVLWTITLPDIHITDVQASADGRWRAFARRGLQFARIQGIVGDSQFTSTRWTVNTGRRTYVDTPRNDGGSVALAVAPQWDAPALSALLTDWRQTTRLLRVDEAGTTELATSHLRVECPAPPIGVTGYICVSYDGRSSRIWRIDLTSGHLLPVAETRHVILSASQDSQQRLTGAVNGRPMIADLESRTLTTLIPEPYCWAMDVDVAKDVAVSICTDGVFTTATQYRLPASAY